MDGYKLFSNLFFLAISNWLLTLLVTSSQRISPCAIGGCWCSDDSRPISGLNVTCNVKVVSNKSKIIRSLSPNSDIKYLSFRCETLTYKSHLDDKLLARFPALEYLSIDSCVVDTIHPAFISNFSNLQEIRFQRVTFTTTQISLMSKTMKSLTIVNSELPQFPNIFGCSTLETVTIVHNKLLDPVLLSLVENGTILSNLKTLSLTGNGITVLPSALFKFLPSLMELQLSQNFIRDISFSPDSDLSNLEILNGLENPLEFIDTRALVSSTKLRWLRVYGMGRIIDLEFLSFLKNLEDLQLSNFNINSSIWDFLRWSALARLDLSHNQLTSVNLTALPSLQILLLQFNAIAHLPHNVFVKQTDLVRLDLSQNKIDFLPKSLFENNLNLKAMAFTSNAITSLPGQLFSSTRQLFYIHLANNSLTTLPDEIFMSLHNLRFLYLDNNRLESAPLFPRQNALTHLFMSYNSITSLKYSDFHHLNLLQILKLDYNRIEYIPTGIFSSCPQLLHLSVTNNHIEELKSFGSHANLLELFFQNNRIKRFSSFSGVKRLQILYLDSNYITRIPPNSFPKTIRVINLSYNHLFYIRRDVFFNLPLLENVYIEGNQTPLTIHSSALSIFSENVLKPSFSLENSTLKCDCNMGYIKVYLTIITSNVIDHGFIKYYPRFIGLQKTDCVSYYFPGERRPLPDTQLDQFVCNTTFEADCDYNCQCCSRKSACDCYLTCPEKCQCFNAGASRQEIFRSVRCDRTGLTSVPWSIHSFATQVLLDGNYLDTIKNYSFTNLTRTRELNLNGSHISTIDDGAFDNMSSLRVLRLNDNRIQKICSNTFGNVSTLRQLFLDQNKIQTIELSAFDGLTSLEILYLDTNELQSLNPVLNLPSLTAVTLAFNPWSCACADGWDTVRHLATVSDVVVDRNKVCCDMTVPTNFSYSDYITGIENHRAHFSTTRPPAYSGRRNSSKDLISVNSESGSRTLSLVIGNYTNALNQSSDGALNNDICYQLVQLDRNLLCTMRYNDSFVEHEPVGSSDHVTARLMPPLISLVIFLALIGIAVVLLLWKRNIVQAWLYAKAGVRILDKKAAADREDKGSKPFDAFISFSQKDVGYVVNTLVPALEDKRYRLCVHYRDFPVGGDICTVVRRAIELSSRTILVVSPHFLKSDWCRFEFQTAHHHVLQKGCHRLILVILGDLPPNEIDPDLRVQLKTKTYLKSDDPWFWEKLYFALPDITGGREDDDWNALKGMEILSQDADDNGVGLKDRLNEDNNEEDGNNDDHNNEDVAKNNDRIEWANGAFELQEDEIRIEPWWGNATEI